MVTGDTYTLSAWVRDGWADGSDNTIPAGLQFEQRLWDGVSAARGDEVDVDGSGATNDDRINHFPDIPKDGEWHFLTVTHQIPTGVNMVTAIVNTVTRNTNLDIDDVSLIRGSTDRSHNPGPSDVYGGAGGVLDALELFPRPEYGGENVSLTPTLTWDTGLSDVNDPDSAPNPNIVKHNLWLSAGYDAATAPAWPDWDDAAVQIFEIPADSNPADGSVDPSASKQLTGLQKNKLYFWIVDESLTGATGLEDWPNIIAGTTWAFKTITNAPVVDAGPNILTWLKANGETTVDLNGVVTDDDVALIQWSSPDANVVFANSAVAVTTATVKITGTFDVQLYAKDAANNEGSDNMEIRVFADACEAAKSNPNGYVGSAYDHNGDCKVNFLDFAMAAVEWLDDRSLTEDLLF